MFFRSPERHLQLLLLVAGTEAVVGPDPVGLWTGKPLTVLSTDLSRLS